VLVRGLQPEYVNDQDIRKYVKYLAALAFVPVNRVRDAFDTISSSPDFPENDALEDLYSYFERTYVGSRRRRGRTVAPRYEVAFWSMWERVASDLPRTNNIVEGWHREIQASLDGDHPSIWRFLRFLQREETLSRLTREQIVAGQNPRKEKRDQKRRTQNLRTLSEDFENRNIEDYLRGVAYNIELDV
jgi:hypothetical protein